MKKNSWTQTRDLDGRCHVFLRQLVSESMDRLVLLFQRSQCEVELGFLLYKTLKDVAPEWTWSL